MLQSMRSQRVIHDLVIERQQHHTMTYLKTGAKPLLLLSFSTGQGSLGSSLCQGGKTIDHLYSHL